MPDVLRLWDSLLSDPNRFKLLNFVQLAMIIDVRDEILGGEFADCITALQNTSALDLQNLLNRANDLLVEHERQSQTS